MFVAKLCPVSEVGRYALAIAWAAPVMLAARMQLRYVLAADAGGALPLSVAALARLVATFAALAGLAAGAFLAASPSTAWTILLVALVRAAEDAGELLLGLAQRDGDWAAITRSLALRGLGGAAAFGGALALHPELPGALLANMAWQAAVTCLHDWPAVRGRAGSLQWPVWARVSGAVRAHAALGGAAALVSLNAYIPRYAVERSVGLEAVGVFTALAQLALVGNMAVQAVGQAAVAPLSRTFVEDPRRFAERTAGLAVFAALCGAAGLALSFVAGPFTLALLYRPEYVRHGAELNWMMAAAAMMYLTAVLGYALVAAGERRLQLRIFGASSAAALAASLLLTPVWGMRGAAVALLISWSVAAAGAVWTLAGRLGAWRRTKPSPKLSGWSDSEPARPGAAR